MTKFQKLLIEHEFCCEGNAEEWARHVEDALNNSGLKVVEVYDEDRRAEEESAPWSPSASRQLTPPGTNPWAGLKGNHPMADGL